MEVLVQTGESISPAVKSRWGVEVAVCRGAADKASCAEPAANIQMTNEVTNRSPSGMAARRDGQAADLPQKLTGERGVPR